MRFICKICNCKMTTITFNITKRDITTLFLFGIYYNLIPFLSMTYANNFVCDIYKNIDIFGNMRSRNWQIAKKSKSRQISKGDNSVSYYSIYLKFYMWSHNRLMEFFCSLTYIQLCIFNFLLYKHWRPSWIFINIDLFLKDIDCVFG